MSIIIASYSDSDKVPGFWAETVFGAGAINIKSIPLILLLVGLKATAAGSALADVDLLEVQSKDDADTFWGAGSELARQCYAAIDEGQGYRLMGIAPVDGGGVAASATITITGTASVAGQWTYYLHGIAVVIGVNVGDSPTVQAAAIRDKFNQTLNGRMGVIATASVGVATLTAKQKGIRGNDLIIYQDISLFPTSCTSALAGGAAVTGSTNVSGIRFSGGTVAESLTNVLAVIYAGRYNRIAPAQYDATSLTAWATQINQKAGVLEGRTEHVVIGHNGTQSAAKSIAQTTLNNSRFQVVWMLNSETHPSEMAAAMGAARAAREQSNPNQGYDGYLFATIKPQRFAGDVLNRVGQQSCLDNSVTPLVTNSTGQVKCIRAITTHSLNGVTPDYRTLDTNQAVVPDFVRDDLNLFWTTSFVIDNPYVAPDPGPTDPPTPPSVATPSLWTSEVTKKLFDYQKQLLVTQVSTNLPLSEYNTAANRIMSIVKVVPLPIQHSIGVSIRQGNVV